MNEKFRDVDRSGCGCVERGEVRSSGCDDRQRGDCGCEQHQRRGRGGSCDRDENRSRERGERRTSRRQEMLLKIQQLNFMMIEAGLFLNNQCDCEAAQVAFCDYQRRHAEAVAEYEACFGPLTYMGVNAKSDGWSWVRGPWPWEAEDC